MRLKGQAGGIDALIIIAVVVAVAAIIALAMMRMGYVGGAAVVAPYFGNATLYYLYPMCPGGYRLSERAVNLDNTPISITIILINCS